MISLYAVASTVRSAFIIGGKIGNDANSNSISTSIVAEFRDDQWRKYGNLMNSRLYHSAISFNSKTMIIGGYK